MYRLYVLEEGFGTQKIGVFNSFNEAKVVLKKHADNFFEFFEAKCTYTISCDEYAWEVVLSNL